MPINLYGPQNVAIVHIEKNTNLDLPALQKQLCCNLVKLCFSLSVIYIPKIIPIYIPNNS